VPNYARAEFAGVYRGIDVVYHGGDDGRLEYDFIVAPGADPSAIRLRAEGATSVEIDAAGNLLIHTATATLSQQAPVAYQDVDGTHQAVQSRYEIDASGDVRVEVGAYDPAAGHRPGACLHAIHRLQPFRLHPEPGDGLLQRHRVGLRGRQHGPQRGARPGGVREEV
jgi:hypothetical protein